MHLTRSLVDMSVKKAADTLATIAIDARRRRIEKQAEGAFSPGSTLGGGLLGAGLGALGGAGMSSLGNSPDESGRSKRRRRFGNMLSGALAGGALGGGLGLANSSGAFASSPKVNSHSGLPKGQFVDPRTGKTMTVDPKSLGSDPATLGKVRELSEKSPSTRVADAIGQGVGTAAYYAPFSSGVGTGLLGREVHDRMNIFRNPRNLAAAFDDGKTTSFLGDEASSSLKDLKGASPSQRLSVLHDAAGPTLYGRLKGLGQSGTLSDRVGRLLGRKAGDQVVHTSGEGAQLNKADLREVMRRGHQQRMGGLGSMASRAVLPMALGAGADLGLNYVRGISQDAANEKELRKLMARYAKPVE